MPAPVVIDSVRTVAVDCPICETAAKAGQPFARGQDFEYGTSPDEFDLLRCSGCGVLFLSPRPDTSELPRIYPDEYAPYHFGRRRLTLKVRSWLERNRVKALRRMLPDDADIMDAGCGGPAFLDELRRHGKSGWRLWGNDINAAAMDDIRRAGYRTAPGRIESLDLPASSFDAIILKQVLEHLENPATVLAGVTRLLRPGGRLIVETPNYKAWDARLFRKRYWGGYHFPRHWTIFDATTLVEAGRRVGLEKESVTYMLSPSFWVQSLHHLLKERGWPGLIIRSLSHLNPLAMGAASALDLLQRFVAGRTSNMQIIFVKPAAEAVSTQ